MCLFSIFTSLYCVPHIVHLTFFRPPRLACGFGETGGGEEDLLRDEEEDDADVSEAILCESLSRAFCIHSSLLSGCMSVRCFFRNRISLNSFGQSGHGYVIIDSSDELLSSSGGGCVTRFCDADLPPRPRLAEPPPRLACMDDEEVEEG